MFLIKEKSDSFLALVMLVCTDYGFDCDYMIEGNDAETVFEKFAKHMSDEHGIKKSEALTMLIDRTHNLVD